MRDTPAIALVPVNPALAAELAPLRVIEPAAIPAHAGAVWVFVDCLLPDSSGFEFCRRLRADPASAAARVVIVLDDDDRELRRRSLQAGADDYAIGPLTAALVRARLSPPASPPAPAPPPAAPRAIELDRAAFQIRVGGRRAALAPNEFNLLAYLLDNRDRLLSRRELIGALREGGPAIDERTVDVWIGRLRRAIAATGAEAPIRTVRSLGYVFDS